MSNRNMTKPLLFTLNINYLFNVSESDVADDTIALYAAQGHF